MAKVLLLLLFVLSAFQSLVSGYRGPMVGGRMQVTDVKTNKEVQELGKFSVEEFNKQLHHHGNGGEELIFSQVVEAQKQVVSGIKYYLKIEAKPNTDTVVLQNEEETIKVFDSQVVVKAWLNSKELISFQPSEKFRVRKL